MAPPVYGHGSESDSRASANPALEGTGRLKMELKAMDVTRDITKNRFVQDVVRESLAHVAPGPTGGEVRQAAEVGGWAAGSGVAPRGEVWSETEPHA